MSGAQQKIGIFGDFNGSSFGNEGPLKAMIAFPWQVRPGTELIFLCHSPEAVSKSHRIKALAYRARRPARSLSTKIKARYQDLRLIFRGTCRFEVLIIPGTSILDDFGEIPQRIPLTIFLVCLFARLRGARICLVSIGADPIEYWLSRWLMKSAATLGHYRSSRDLPSEQFMKKLGLEVDRPTASTGYSVKFEALLTEMGLGEFCQHVESFDVELLKAHVTELIRKRDIYKHSIHRANVAFAERLRCRDRILAWVFGGAQLAGAL
jgi:polysaccharide pyruvyl transferase WcaK-like protein